MSQQTNVPQASSQTGLLFPAGRIWNEMKTQANDYDDDLDDKHIINTITPEAAIYLTAVIQSTCAELLQLSGNAAASKDKKRIEPPDILKAIRADNEFGRFFGTRESKSRLSVPASPFDGDHSKKNSKATQNRLSSNLREWAEHEHDNDNDDDTDDGSGSDIIPYTQLEMNQSKATDTEDTDTDSGPDTVSDNDIQLEQQQQTPAQTAFAYLNLADILNDDSFIDGLFYIENYIDNCEQNDIVSYLYNNEWNKQSHRIVQQYEYGNLKPFDCIPVLFENILSRIVSDNRFGIENDYHFDHLFVNNYPSFGGMDYHLDNINYFDEFIVDISLLNECVMHFQNIKTNQIKSILLKPKSLLILSGNARYKWKHSIKEKEIHFYDGIPIKRKNRISLTFRKTVSKHLNLTQSNNKCNGNVLLQKIDALLNFVDQYLLYS